MRRLLPFLIACFLIACFFILTPYVEAQAASVAQAQTTTTYRGTVNTNANIRSGPGTQYDVVGQAQSGESVTVVACNADCTWLQLDNGNWIAAFLVDLVDSSSSTPSERTRSRTLDTDDLELNPASDAALEVVEQILSYTGLPQSFEVYSANIYNAAALMADGERVILYDPQLIADIENITQHDWPAVSILAHEIGHHLAGHTLAASYNRTFEIEADYFSGFILQKMGATLPEAQAVMSLLRDHPNMTDHPPQAERLAAIEEGWQAAADQGTLAAWEPAPSGFAEEAAINAAGRAALPNAASVLSVLQGARYSSAIPRDWSLGLAALAR